MRQVRCDAGGVDNIVESELVDQRGELQKKGQRLSKIVSYAFGHVAIARRRQTCPMPPAAPATTVQDSLESLSCGIYQNAGM